MLLPFLLVMFTDLSFTCWVGFLPVGTWFGAGTFPSLSSYLLLQKSSVVCIPFTFANPSTPVLGRVCVWVGAGAVVVVVFGFVGIGVVLGLGFRTGSCGGWVGVWMSLVTWVLAGLLLGLVGFVLGGGGWLTFGVGLVHNLVLIRVVEWLLGGSWFWTGLFGGGLVVIGVTLGLWLVVVFGIGFWLG